ncbi:cell division protein FtsQ/DivIB [Actinoallomurus soli]|uniref:cell division protein FtsQ/DivIB n=1 Tax=Actinoallomurus soli TaxID=2952535 RepID=UPI002092D083|nr:FtsQ-type POTRA domain-containing protein [Actinoallomurus soli]MCO5967241.1 FtsQ-type POTRA domain-containing protein [Actinoallomurus soli]
MEAEDVPGAVGTDPGVPDAGAPVRPSRPARRRPNRWKVLFVGLFVAGVLGTATWVLLGSRLLVVRHIDVTGERLVSREEVLAAARVRLGEPLARLDTGVVRDRVEMVQAVETARVERRWPTTVRIVVRERTPIVVAQRGNRYLQIDRYGVTVVTSAARPRGLPVIDVANPTQSDPALRAGLSVVQGLPSWLGRQVVGVDVPSTEAVSLRLADGVTVVWGAAERGPEKLRLLHGLLGASPRRGVQTIDVSSPEVVTTK